MSHSKDMVKKSLREDGDKSREALSISSPSRNLILKEKSQLSGLLKVNGMNFRRLEPALSMKISLREFLSSLALMSQSLLQSQ